MNAVATQNPLQTKTIKRVDAIRWDMFADKSDVNELFGTRTELSVQDVIDSKVEPRDKLWALLRNPPLSDEQLHEFACWLAERELRARHTTRFDRWR